ncbi:hypothetical protein Tco_1318380 [Tanacetum coccineum]
MVKDSLQKFKNHLDKFDDCIKDRTVVTSANWREWGMSYIKDAYEEEVIPFAKNLRESFKLFEMEINNKSFEINDLKGQLQDKSIVVNELKRLLAKLKGKSQVTPCETTNLDSRFLKLDDENVSLDFKFIPKVVKKNDLSKTVTSHLHTNKVIKKCTKVLAPGLLKIKSEPMNAKVSYTYASESQPKSNARNDRIQRPSSSSQKNKVEAQLRKFKSSLNKNNHVSDCNANAKNVALSSNSNNVCLSCNECLFSSNHDACVVNYLKDVKKYEKAKSVKQKENIQWKPTRRVFTTVGNRWIPTGKTFSIVGTMYPLTKITPATIVPSRNRLQTISIPAIAPNAETRMRNSIAKNSLIRAHINCYGHPFKKPNFSLIRKSEVLERPS